jgi:hypothetical protein
MSRHNGWLGLTEGRMRDSRCGSFLIAHHDGLQSTQHEAV